MLKNHKSFSIDIGNYQDISLQNCPLSAHFWRVKIQSRKRAPPNLVNINHSYKHPYCVKILAVHTKWFLSDKKINKFSKKKSPFFMFICVSSHDRVTYDSRNWYT